MANRFMLEYQNSTVPRNLKDIKWFCLFVDQVTKFFWMWQKGLFDMLGLNRLSKPLEMSPHSVRRNNKFVLVKVSNLWIGVKTQRVNLAICPIFVPNSGFLSCPNRPLLYSNRCVCRSSQRYFRDLEVYTLGLGEIGPEAKIWYCFQTKNPMFK